MAAKIPEPITRDQQFLAAILSRLEAIDQRLRAIEQGVQGCPEGSAVCDVCGRTFSNARALRAHQSRSHKKE